MNRRADVMPEIAVRIDQEADGSVPLRLSLASRETKPRERCLAALANLAE